MTEAGWCPGLDPEAKKYWNDWYIDVTNRKLPSNVVGIRARAPTIARKIALIYGWDFGPATTNQPWQMGMDTLEPAIAAAELHIKSLVHLSDVIAEHNDARLRRSVIQSIHAHGGMCTLGEILGRLKMRKRPILEIIDALKEEGRVKQVKTQLGLMYQLIAISEADKGSWS